MSSSPKKRLHPAWVIAAFAVVFPYKSVLQELDAFASPPPSSQTFKADAELVESANLSVLMNRAMLSRNEFHFSSVPTWGASNVTASAETYTYNRASMQLCKFAPGVFDKKDGECRNTITMDMEQRQKLEEAACLQATMQGAFDYKKKFCRPPIMT